VVNHPLKWAHNGYHEIQKPPERYAVIDLQGLTTLCGFTELGDFQRAHRQWVDEALEGEPAARDDRWSEAIAVGSLAFVETVKNDLGVKATHREVIQADGVYALREPSEAYAGKFTGKIDALRTQNTILWDESVENAAT
jgi:putative transposase